MSGRIVQEIRVGVDVGCHSHNVAIGLPDGHFLEEFEIPHTPDGFREFFSRIGKHEQKYNCNVAVAMEGYNGHARPLDTMVRVRNYQLYNINNLKLARFKEIFPAAAKTDTIDARKALELFQLQDHLESARGVLQEVQAIPVENAILKRLTRRRRSLVNEHVRIINSIQADLRAVCPGLLEITNSADNLWFLNFLTSTDSFKKIARLRYATLLKIPGVGKRYAGIIQNWQTKAHFSHEVDWVGDMIQEDALRVLDLHHKIKLLEKKCTQVATNSALATLIISIPGFGPVCSSTLAGEIGTGVRFSSEASLALYLGMATLDKSSGNHKGSRSPKQVNTRAKAAMMIAVDRHRKYVPESTRYYLKKRLEGKAHNQAIRALGRHLCRVIFKMIKEERTYQIRN
ncbi:MAG: IS110 family transposase [Thermodesulfobacteriota bacterium]|nr:IS110 family transposase [Thermodesulfobacteriota bacterium]